MPVGFLHSPGLATFAVLFLQVTSIAAKGRNVASASIFPQSLNRFKPRAQDILYTCAEDARADTHCARSALSTVQTLRSFSYCGLVGNKGIDRLYGDYIPLFLANN